MLCSVFPAIAQDEFLETGVEEFTFFVEILDAEIYPDNPNLIYLLGVGGLLFIDVSEADNPRLIGRHTPPSIYERYYNGQATGALAVTAAREDGLDFIDISDVTNPDLLTRYRHEEFAYESVVFRDSIAWAAAHSNGLEILNIIDPANPAQLAVVNSNLENTWDVFLDGDKLYVADGPSGLKIFDLSNPANPQFISSIPLSGYCKEVIIHNDLAYIAVGAAGFDIVDVSNPAQPQFLSNYRGGFGLTNHLAYDNGIIYAASWELVEAVDVSDPLNPARIATEETPYRAMGIAARDGRVFVTDWWIFRAYNFQDFDVADIHIKPEDHDFGFQGVGVPITEEYKIFNLGESNLEISNISSPIPHYTISPTTLTVPPGDTGRVDITFTPSGIGTRFAVLNVYSNDPDEAEKSMSVFGGESRLSPGDSAVGFTLNDIDGNTHMLEQYRGKVVLLIFFATW